MAQQIINVGASPNDGTGDTLRDSQVKANQNFTELYASVGGGATTPNLQQVTDQGNTTTNDIIAGAFLSSGSGNFGSMVMNDGDLNDILYLSSLSISAEPKTIQFPNQSGIIALTSDLNSKQDKLTAENVGQFMDLDLSTKTTPISADTILARDSVTNEAVEIPFSAFNKRTFVFHWQINQSIPASASWYRQDPQVGTRGNFTTNASLTPTNAFANNTVLTPAFTLPFQAKIKSVTVYGWTNQGATNVRFCVNSSKLSTSSGVSTPVDCLILADFSVNTQNIQVNGFRHEQTTSLNTATLPALQEIRLFFNNNNVSSNIYDGLITVEFEEVI